MSQTDSAPLRVAFDCLSKNALADLALDLMRQQHGESLDGEAAVAALRKAFEPIAIARGDKTVPTLREAVAPGGRIFWTTRTPQTMGRLYTATGREL